MIASVAQRNRNRNRKRKRVCYTELVYGIVGVLVSHRAVGPTWAHRLLAGWGLSPTHVGLRPPALAMQPVWAPFGRLFGPFGVALGGNGPESEQYFVFAFVYEIGRRTRSDTFEITIGLRERVHRRRRGRGRQRGRLRLRFRCRMRLRLRFGTIPQCAWAHAEASSAGLGLWAAGAQGRAARMGGWLEGRLLETGKAMPQSFSSGSFFPEEKKAGQPPIWGLPGTAAPDLGAAGLYRQRETRPRRGLFDLVCTDKKSPPPTWCGRRVRATSRNWTNRPVPVRFPHRPRGGR